MSVRNPTVVYTLTDEAPALATHSFLPIVQAFTGAAGVEVETRDISLAARVLAQFDDRLTGAQKSHDALAELGELATRPEANIIKLPNISASIPQLKAAIGELQGQGYGLPDYPDEAFTEEEREVRARYDRVKGSAVNPVLREGNSDRRAPAAVKQYARAHPHSMGAWSADSASHVAHMTAGDFRSNERSLTLPADTTVRIEHVAADGSVSVMKADFPVQAGEIVDATFMSRKALTAFLAREIDDAKARGVLFSLHLKATMMKVSDPIIFGHAVRVFFGELFERHGEALARVGADPTNGLGSVIASTDELPADERDAARKAIADALERGPAMAMVNSDKGITNLHVPSDVIVDASMPAMIRTSGKMWKRRRATAGHQGGDSRQLLRRRLPGDDRLLQAARRVRSEHDGHRAERRSDGAEGRGVRLARQDLRGARRGHDARRRRPRRRAREPCGRGGRHLAHVQRQGRADPRLGQARRVARPAPPALPPSSGSTRRARTTPS